VALAAAGVADLVAAEVLAAPEAAGAAAAVIAGAAGAAAAGAVAAAFCTPPCPLQAPLPVVVEVLPSLQVVGVGVAESARAGNDNVNTIKGAARSPAKFAFFIRFNSLV
jgi:hypothetical protein